MHVYSTSFNNKSKLLDEMMQVLIYVVFYISSTKIIENYLKIIITIHRSFNLISNSW